MNNDIKLFKLKNAFNSYNRIYNIKKHYLYYIKNITSDIFNAVKNLLNTSFILCKKQEFNEIFYRYLFKIICIHRN